MLMPSIFEQNLFDNFWGFPAEKSAAKSPAYQMMQTDIKEKEHEFDVTMNLPGFSKEDVKGELKDGYLIISASSDRKNDEKDSEGRYIRRERYTGSCSRTFYVGENVTQEDIKAKFEDGTLKFTIPKKEDNPAQEESKLISIE